MILCNQKIIFLLILMFLPLLKMFGQDVRYSQFYANPVYLNPAFTGSATCPRFSINFRDQYPAIPRNYVSFSGSYDQHIAPLHGGLGLVASTDITAAKDVGWVYRTFNAGLIYNFRVRISNNYNLHFALQGTYMTTALNRQNLTFASEMLYPGTPPELLAEYYKHSQFNAEFGWLAYSNYLYFGMAIHHLVPVPVSFIRDHNDKFKTKWEPKWTAHLGGKITIKQHRRHEYTFGDIFLHPNIVFISQGISNYLHEGFYFNFYPFTVGTWLRHNFHNVDALIVTCGLEYKQLRIGYSYDFNLTKLERTGGAHEVSLQFIIPCNPDKSNTKKKNSAKYSSVACPNF